MCKVFQIYIHLAGANTSLAVQQSPLICYIWNSYFVKRGFIILHILTVGKYLSGGG